MRPLHRLPLPRRVRSLGLQPGRQPRPRQPRPVRVRLAVDRAPRHRRHVRHEGMDARGDPADRLPGRRLQLRGGDRRASRPARPSLPGGARALHQPHGRPVHAPRKTWPSARAGLVIMGKARRARGFAPDPGAVELSRMQSNGNFGRRWLFFGLLVLAAAVRVAAARGDLWLDEIWALVPRRRSRVRLAHLHPPARGHQPASLHALLLPRRRTASPVALPPAFAGRGHRGGRPGAGVRRRAGRPERSSPSPG